MSEHAIVDKFMTGFLQKDLHIYKYTVSGKVTLNWFEHIKLQVTKSI